MTTPATWGLLPGVGDACTARATTKGSRLGCNWGDRLCVFLLFDVFLLLTKGGGSYHGELVSLLKQSASVSPQPFGASRLYFLWKTH